MKQTIAPKQSSFFNHHHYLELEGLLKEGDAEKLLQSTQGIPLLESRDIWRRDEGVRSISLRKSFSHCAKELFQCKFLHLAFDQSIHTPLNEPAPFQENLSLNDCCSFQSLAGGLILRLSQTKTTVEASETLCPLPQKKGSGIFFAADVPIDWDKLLSLPNESLWLIAYCPMNTVYVHNPVDPFNNLLKGMRYGFGDRLETNKHPLV